MERFYEFAGVSIVICIPDAVMCEEDGRLAPFRCDAVTEPHRFVFEPVERLSAPEGACIVAEPALQVYEAGDVTVRYIGSVQRGWENGYIRVENRGREHRVELKASAFPTGVGSKTVLNSLAAEHLVAQNSGIVFHSSFVEYNEKGILFSAPSGTGKSTQADLWQKYRGAGIINGDRSAIRVTEGGIVAYGTPFAGSSNICLKKTLPLAAVVYLKQAPQNRIRRLAGAEAFCRIWEGCSVNTWDKADVAAVSATVQQVIGAVPVFELACTPDEMAVKTLEEACKQEGIL